MTDIILGTVTLDNVVDYTMVGSSSIKQRSASRQANPWWIMQDAIKQPMQYKIIARGNNTLVTDLRALFRLHTWQGLDDDGDGEDEWDVIITDLGINYRAGFATTNDQWEITLIFYRRPPTNLVTWLKFDYNLGSIAFDSSKNENHGIITDATWASGKIGNSLLFNGSSANVDCGDIDDLDGLTAITVTAWIKVAASSEDYHTTCRKEFVFVLGHGWTAHKPMFWVNDGTWKNSGDGSTTVDDGEWYFIAGVYDGDYIRIFVNGEEENSNQVGSITLASNSNKLYVGSNQGSAEFFNGNIDDVRVYDRALSAAEILELYQRWT